MADNDDIVQKVRIEVESDADASSAFEKLKSAASEAFEAIKGIFSGGDFGSTFSKIGEAGSSAFNALKESASGAFATIKDVGSGAFAELSSLISASAGNIGKVLLGVAAALAGLGLAIGLAIKGMFSFVESQSQAVNSLGDLADKTQTPIEALSKLETAYAHAGVSAKEFTSGISSLSSNIAKSWEQIKKDAESGATDLEEKAISAEKAAQRLQEARRENTAQRPVQRETLAREINQFRATPKEILPLSEDEAREKLEPSVGKTDLHNKSVEESRKKSLALREAELANTKAQKAQADEVKNSLQSVTKGVQDLISGSQSALSGFNATAENIVKGVVAASGQGQEALSKLGEGFSLAGAKAPELTGVLDTLGAALKNIDDPALRLKVSLAALGPSGQAFLNALDSGKLEAFKASMSGLGNATDEVDKKLAGNFKASITGLGATIDDLQKKLAAPFSGGFSKSMEELDGFISRISPNIRTLADLLSSALTGPLKAITSGFIALGEAANVLIDIIRNIGGALQSIAKADFKGIISSMKNLGEIAAAVYKILTGIATLNFDKVKEGLDDLAKQRAKEQEEKSKGQLDEQKKTDAKTPEQREQRRFDDSNKKQVDANNKLADAFQKFQETLPKVRNEGLSPELGQAADFQKFKQQQQQEPQKATADQKRVDADNKLANAFQKFQETLPKSRNEGLTDEQKEAADFQKFKQQGSQAPVENKATSDLLQGLKNLVTGNAGDQIKRDLGGGLKEDISELLGALRRGLGQDDALKPKPEDITKPDASTSIGEKIQSLFEGLVSKINELGTKPGEKITDPNAGIGVRGDAGQELDKAASSATQLASALDAAAQAAKPKETGSDQAGQANQTLASSAQQASSALDSVASSGQQIATVGQVATTTGASLSTVGTAADSVASPLQSLASAANSAAAALQQLQGGSGGSNTATVSAAEGGWIRGPGTETSDSIPAWLSHNEFVQPARATRHYGVAFMEAIRNLQFPKFSDGGLVNSMFDNIAKFASGGSVSGEPGATASSVQRAFDVARQRMDNLAKEIDKTNTAVNDNTTAINQHEQRIVALEKGGEDSVSAAFGGWIRGPGSETSDSIPAWLSHNEFVQPARATRHYGVEFMESIRNLSFPKFSMGGLAGLLSPQMPRFALGGAVEATGGGALPHLGTVDLSTDRGPVRVAVDRDGIKQLRDAAVRKNIGKGPQPSWVK